MFCQNLPHVGNSEIRVASPPHVYLGRDFCATGDRPVQVVSWKSVLILVNFWKVEVGTLEICCDLDYDHDDREVIIARAKPSLFCRGVRGHAHPENFENRSRDCQIRIFLMFRSTILHFYCKKK